MKDLYLAKSKIMKLDDISAFVENKRKYSADIGHSSVVATNGGFDICTAAHATYLANSAALGDMLVVGINSDKSIRNNKNPNRPIVNENDRALILACMFFVDAVVIYDDADALNFLDKVRPNIYTKGSDYNINSIVQSEREFVELYGGKVEIVDGIEGVSTTNIIKKVLEIGEV